MTNFIVLPPVTRQAKPIIISHGEREGITPPTSVHSVRMEEVDVIVEVSAAATLLFWRKRREEDLPFPVLFFFHSFPHGTKELHVLLAVGAEFGKNISHS